jgi:hypothetical protein
MKKILTLAIITLALWATSTFFIGNQTKEALENYINKSNKLYATSGIELKLLDYNKSFLNSDAKVELSIIDPAILKLLGNSYTFPLKMDYKIEHGPLFFKNGFGFGLAKIKHHLLLSSIFKEDARKEFLKLVKEDVNLKTDVIISFSKEANYKMLSDEVKLNLENKTFTMTPLSLTGKSNLESFKGTAFMQVHHIEIKEEKSTNGIQIKKFTLDMDMKEFLENSLVFGDFGLSIENLIIKDDGNPELANIDISLQGKMRNERTSETLMNSIFEGDVDFKDTLLPNELKPLQKVYLKMNLDNLGIQGMLEFQKSAQTMQEEQSKLIAKIQEGSQKDREALFSQFGKIQEKMMNQIIHSLNSLLIKDKTTITYAFDVETKDKHKSQTMAKIGYTGDMKFEGTMEELSQKVQKQILSLISVNLDVNLNKNHLKLLPNAQSFQPQIQMGVMQGFIKDNNSSYSINATYKNKELMVNDNNLTATILPFLMMATQAGGL